MPDPETLGGLLDKHLDIYAYCNRCNHSSVVPIALAVTRLGPGCPVPAAAGGLVCSSCGSKDIGTRPNWPDNIGLAWRSGSGD